MDIKRKTMITGSLIAGALMGTVSLNAAESNLFSYNELGSGSEIRANLLNQSKSDFKSFLLELNCGEKTSKASKSKTTETKSKEAKCGEGKCGDAKGTKADKSTDKSVKSTDTKSAKAKDTKSAKAKDTKKSKESKSKEAKCGEGKCGVE